MGAVSVFDEVNYGSCITGIEEIFGFIPIQIGFRSFCRESIKKVPI